MSAEGNAVLIDALGSALRRGDNALQSVPGLLKRVLAEESWRDFLTQRGEHVAHERFADFVVTPPLRGLGAEVALVRRIVADDLEAVDLLDQALQNAPSVHAGNNSPGRPEGTSKAKALRKLRKDQPELHADVLAGKLTAHAAMVKAGYWPPTFTVRADSAESVAATLRKKLTNEQIADLVRLLSGRAA